MILLLDTESTAKGQLILKADWRGIDSPKKRTDKFVSFSFLLFMANKSNLSLRLLGESAARQSALWFYLTFNTPQPQGGSKLNVSKPDRLIGSQRVCNSLFLYLQ